jgi:hypothetical protein
MGHPHDVARATDSYRELDGKIAGEPTEEPTMSMPTAGYRDYSGTAAEL